MTNDLTVIKCDAFGDEMWCWEGRELQRSATEVLLEAHFNMDEHHLGEMVLRRGDRLVESYYSDRWYNIFEVRAGEDDALKGWYCNLSYPAVLGERVIEFRDLALDLIVHADGRQELLDEDEFEELLISDEVRKQALHAWEELQALFRERFR
jgi:predicted RNA-binding protein associated with RNAse of E/G family